MDFHDTVLGHYHTLFTWASLITWSMDNFRTATQMYHNKLMSDGPVCMWKCSFPSSGPPTGLHWKLCLPTADTIWNTWIVPGTHDHPQYQSIQFSKLMIIISSMAIIIQHMMVVLLGLKTLTIWRNSKVPSCSALVDELQWGLWTYISEMGTNWEVSIEGGGSDSFNSPSSQSHLVLGEERHRYIHLLLYVFASSSSCYYSSLLLQLCLAKIPL